MEMAPIEKGIVSTKLLLNQELRSSAKQQQLAKVPLVPLNCSFGVVTEGVKSRSFRSMVRHERKKQQASDSVTVVFAVRYPGCGLCMEIGQALSQLAKEEDVALMGVVKEGEQNSEALLQFHNDHFRFPLYMDADWKVYRAMGGRKICTIEALKGFFKCRKRLKQKNIKCKAGKGDPWMLGGVLIFDRSGTLRYAYEEEFGKEIDMDAIRTAIQAARCDCDSSQSSWTYATCMSSKSLGMSAMSLGTSSTSLGLSSLGDSSRGGLLMSSMADSQRLRI